MKTNNLLRLFTITICMAIAFAIGVNAEPMAEMPFNSVNGKIVDEQSGSPIEFASVAVFNTSDSSLVSGTMTDENGNFKIKDLKIGKYYVKATFIGYDEYVSTGFSVSKAGKSANLGDIAMKSKNTKIDEVVVKGEKSRIEYKIDKRVINVDKDLNAKGGTAANALENTPSVQVDPQGNVTLRGSSEFIVLIDGKPSVVKGSDALKQIPASAVKQIEVITNPSAKYDAEGQVGIINVVLKKDKLQGLNGNLSASAGTTNKRNGNALLNYRVGKVNLFGGVDYMDNKYSEVIDFNSRTTQNNTSKHTLQSTDQFNKNDKLAFKAGIDYDIDTMNSVSFSGTLGREGYDNGSNSQALVIPDIAGNTTYFSSNNYMDVMGDVYSLNADYSHSFTKDSKISFTNTFYNWKGKDDNKLNELNTNSVYEYVDVSSMLHNHKDNKNYNYRANIDYSTPLFSGNFETGAQFRYEYRWEDLYFENYDVNQALWAKNDTFSNNLYYNNTIYSGYATYSNTVWGINYQLGLRGEVFLRKIEISTNADPYEYNKFMFYPSVHLSKSINEKHQFQLSYSRRINRPQPWILSNNPSYLDSKNVFIGSPYLKPEYTDAYEFNYRTTLKVFTFSTQTYFRNTTNCFQTSRYLNPDGKMYHRLINSDNQQSYGVEQGIDININKWWQINSGANVYHYILKTMNGASENKKEVNTWDARYVNNFNTKWKTRIQTVFYYRAPSIDAVGDVNGFYTVNMAISQSILKDRGNISLSVENILNSIKFDYKVKGAGFDNVYGINAEGTAFMINFSYSFNNFQNKNRGRADALEFKGGGAF